MTPVRKSQALIDSILRARSPRVRLRDLQLFTHEAHDLRAANLADCPNFLYSGIVSLGEAIDGLTTCRFTWATVKLYYSVFYIARARLAADGIALVQDGRPAYSFRCVPSTPPEPRGNNTHEAVLSTFANELSHHRLLTSTIDGKQPLEWLADRRVDANYRISRFGDPTPISHFSSISPTSIRVAVETYVDDILFAFDRDHAMLAFPIQLLMDALTFAASRGIDVPASLSGAEANYLQGLFKDKKGPLPKLVSLWA